MKSFLLLIPLCVNAQSAENMFKIYCFARFQYEDRYNLTNTYDESWRALLNTIALDEAFFVINGNDIEKYHWNNQLIKTTETAYAKLKDEYALSHTIFLVTLNGERLFAGKFIPIPSALALNHPVIYVNAGRAAKPDGNYIQIKARHLLNEENTIEKIIELTGNQNINKIKEYFQAAGKLKE
jgi:hypothetical protein